MANKKFRRNTLHVFLPGGGFIFVFYPKLGEMIHNLTDILSKWGGEKPPTTFQETNISHQTGKGTSCSKITWVGGYVSSQKGRFSRWWFPFFFQMFTPKIGEDSKCDGYFSDGLKPPTRLDYTPEN